MKTKHKHYAVLTASTLGLSGFSFASGFGDEKYIYDASGNMVQKRLGDQVTSYDYMDNQLNGSDGYAGKRDFRYDASGRLISVKNDANSTRKIEHQYWDKVTKVENEGEVTELFYNAEGQLVGSVSAGITEAFAWDGLALVNRAEQLFVNEVHLVGGVPVIIGNEVAVTDMIGSSLSIGYGLFNSTAYGEGLSGGLFTGKPFIKELDSFLFKYRNYSASEGRWHSTDPLGFPDGPNSFAYLRDPNSGVDPLGTEVEEISNTVADPTQGGGNGNWGLNHAASTWTATGNHLANNDDGFEVTLTRSGTGDVLPDPTTTKIKVIFTADDEEEVIHYTAVGIHAYQGSGTAGVMGLTAKMSPNAKSTITATVTGGLALFPSNLDGVNGVTEAANATNVSLESEEGGWGKALTYGGGSWKWAEN